VKFLAQLLFAVILGALIITGLMVRYLPPHHVIARVNALSDPAKVRWTAQSVNELFPTRIVARGDKTFRFDNDSDFLTGFNYTFEGQSHTIESMMHDMETLGLIVVHKGVVIYENYSEGSGPHSHFTSYSVVKSLVSTLVGFAIKDGVIFSVNDKLEVYLPELANTGYAGITIKQALQMSSGIRFDDPLKGEANDTVKWVLNAIILNNKSAFEAALAFPRASPPGTVFNYNTAETQILLELLSRTTKMDAADYMSRKIWQPLGMKHDALWVIDRPGSSGREVGGAFFNATLGDWARFGLFISRGGVWEGELLLPDNWVADATTTTEAHLAHGQVDKNWRKGYGWHWWTFADSTFQADGSRGQSIFIDPTRELVIARASAWPADWIEKYDDHTHAFYDGLMAFIDARSILVVE
jgi:CubicO group peptidase (beta-lactamase class C family)